MSGAHECVLPVRKLRGFVGLSLFALVFLYILSGTYLSEKPRFQSSPRVGRHLLSSPEEESNNCSLLEPEVDISSAHCSDIHGISENSSQCLFILCVESCQNDEGIINYLYFIYCQMPSNLIPLAMVILFVWLIFLFIVLGATAEEYFCPALTVMSQVLRMSQNVAGVTLLAFGNGAPDIFSAIAAINQNDDQKASLAIGALFGAGIFVTTVVVGAVTISKPFILTQRPFLRDIIFYMFAVFWTFYLLWSNYVNVFHAAGFISMYLVYVVVVILGRFLYQRWKKWRNIKGIKDIPTAPSRPEGKELNTSRSTKSPGLFSHLPSPDLGSIQVSNEDVEETNKETDDPHSTFPISNVGVSGGAGLPYPEVKIRVVDDDEEEEINEEETSPLIRPADDRRGDLTGSLPTHLRNEGGLLAPPTQRRRGGSADPPASDYGSTSPPKPHKKRMRKTLSGALDITEEVGAAVGIPHMPQIWEEVHRSHTRSRSSSRVSTHPEMVEEEVSSSESESGDEETPLVNLRKKTPHPFVKLLLALWPFGESFKELGVLGKIYEIIKSPASFFLTLTVPVVDRNEDDHNWNKWLNVLQCVTSPLFIILIIKYRFFLIADVFPVAALVLVLGLVCAVVVAFTSKNEKPPVYHCAYAWVGFAVAVVWIYSTANEIVNLLQAFGIVIHLSEGILGLTLLAWGNSIGDAVSNVTMAKQGFPRMAIGACFGGPLLNMLLGIGLGSMLKSLQREMDNFSFTLYFTQVELIASLFLLLSLSCSLIVIYILKFRMRKPYGIFLIVIYVTFLTVAILAEAKVFQIFIPNVISL